MLQIFIMSIIEHQLERLSVKTSAMGNKQGFRLEHKDSPNAYLPEKRSPFRSTAISGHERCRKQNVWRLYLI